MIKIEPYEYKDEDDLINSFKNTLKPKFGIEGSKKWKEVTDADFNEYETLMPWLKENNFIIVELPNVIERQPNLKSFAYDDIRNYYYEKTGNRDNSVSWEARREIIDELTIVSLKDAPEFEVDENIEYLIKAISTGRGSFNSMGKDEKLKNLNNALEYLLKNEGKYENIDSTVFYDFLGNDEVIKFRNDTQIFRHAARETITERKQWSDNKKNFYIRLGIILITNINNNINDNDFF